MEHDHHHCDDPACACHRGHAHPHHDHDPGHAAAERTAAGAFVLSRSRSLTAPMAPELLAARMEALLLALGDRAAQEDIIPGHIKAAVSAPGGETLGLSITRPGTVDLTPARGWETLSAPVCCTVTVNMMLLTNPGITEADLFAGLA